MQVLGGWGFEGITTFQKGLPLGLTNATKTRSQPTRSWGRSASDVRPQRGGLQWNQNDQREESITGWEEARRRRGSTSTQTASSSRVSAIQRTVFNRFQYGNESRTDSTLRGPGQANYDMSLYKGRPNPR